MFGEAGDDTVYRHLLAVARIVCYYRVRPGRSHKSPDILFSPNQAPTEHSGELILDWAKEGNHSPC
jgi:hypothetical protein